MERWREKENREFLRAGTIAAAALSPYRDVQKHPKPFTAHDIFQLPAPARPKLTRAELIERAESFFTGHNRRVARLEERKRRGAA